MTSSAREDLDAIKSFKPIFDLHIHIYTYTHIHVGSIVCSSSVLMRTAPGARKPVGACWSKRCISSVNDGLRLALLRIPGVKPGMTSRNGLRFARCALLC